MGCKNVIVILLTNIVGSKAGAPGGGNAKKSMDRANSGGHTADGGDGRAGDGKRSGVGSTELPF